MADVAALLRLGAERRIDIWQMVGSENTMGYVSYVRLRISEHWAGDRLASEVDQLYHHQATAVTVRRLLAVLAS